MMRALMIDLGLLVLGIILAVAGWFLTPGAASFQFPGPINDGGQSLIALGLTFVVVAVGLLLAGAEERMMAGTEGPFVCAERLVGLERRRPLSGFWRARGG